MKLIFFEKPGCINNARQKKQLISAGFELDVKNLLKTQWTVEALHSYFTGLAVKDWFNKSAPAIKSGEVTPENITADQALVLMVKDPLLIRRPLISYNGQKHAGYNEKTIQKWLGVEVMSDLETCIQSSSKSCDRTNGEGGWV